MLGLAAPSEIVVDTQEANFELGTWTVAAAATDRYLPTSSASNYRFHSTTGGNPTARVIFTPDIPTDGNYHVDIWYSQGENRATNAPWFISYNGGTEEVKVNQRINGGQWIRIAESKPFAAGRKGFVRLQNDIGTTGMVVLADAVRFVPAVAGAPFAKVVANPSAPSAPPVAAPSSSSKTVNLTVTWGDGGQVVKSPNYSSHPIGSKVTLTARAEEGYVFAGWTGDFATVQNPLTINLNSDRRVTATFAPAGVGVIVDNSDPEVELRGDRGVWAASEQAYRGTKYENHRSTPSKPKATAWMRYTPEIPRAGRYDVYVCYAKGDNRTSVAPWSVSHKGGVVNANVDQKKDGGSWVMIASGVEFEAGKRENQYAELANNAVDAGMIIGDAVAFVYVGK